MSKSLAVKYRPHDLASVTEQDSIKKILQYQLKTGQHKNSYLFCGGAGTGKTTCARIFANEINHGEGQPIELDAASNNGVDDVRQIIQQAQSKSLDSEYKCFIIDECHAISNAGWQAFLKLIEEPPAKSIFLFCTTDPQKIPKTILSRVQRYDFQRISQEGIVNRLRYICDREITSADGLVRLEALEYIAKLADGGMRDAITLLDKCYSYSNEITVGNVIEALGTSSHDIYMKLTDALAEGNKQDIIQIIEDIHSSGKDLKQFVHGELDFVLDVCKYGICQDMKFIQLPETNEVLSFLKDGTADEWYMSQMYYLLDKLIQLDTAIKYNSAPKMYIEAQMLTWNGGGVE